MAARGRATFTRKEEILALLKEDFVKNVNRYLSAVTAAIRDEPPTQAEEIFLSAVAFLSQEIPNPTSQTITPPQLFPASSTFTPGVLTQTSSAFSQVQSIENPSQQSSARSTPITPVQRIENPSIQSSTRSTPITPMQPVANTSIHSSTRSTPITPMQPVANTSIQSSTRSTRLSPPMKRPREEVRQTTTFGPTLTAVAESANVTTQAAAAAAAVTPPPTAPSASALSRPLKDVRHRNSFVAQISDDQSTPDITDVQLLSGGRLLLADWDNKCVKLFDTQRTLQTSRQYGPVTAVNNLTLAVGYWGDSGIDLIDLGGQVLRQICSSVYTNYMDITEDGGLVCSTWDDKIARVQVDTGTVAFNKSVPQIQMPRGVSITCAGSILVTDRDNKTLHLVSSQGDSIKQLWSVPSDRDQDDVLYAVSTDGSVCVCVTLRGSVYILDCL
ncbi:hypothetical protein PoB_004425700 [Plakobranchus ocellatus]|uniref:Uncharacterized protein n=1 Tax=Plakobranchus ocellatus TaxID=259542 RepID=A0AAV4BE88_9GAST|nr:hypothetical protein PoB_004425700 [Plakobranchus ocellatus]